MVNKLKGFSFHKCKYKQNKTFLIKEIKLIKYYISI